MIRKEPRVRPLPRHGTFVPGVSTQNVMRMEPAAMWNEAPQNANSRFYKDNLISGKNVMVGSSLN